MGKQTGSISFEATSGFNTYVKQNYATLSQIKGQFAISTTGASTAAKVATIAPTDSGWTLYKGATVTVKFSNANSATGTLTLNVNSSGAKEIRDYNGNNLEQAARAWPAGAAMALTYDGTYWRIQDSNLIERMHNAETEINQTATSITSLAAMNDTYTDPDGNTVANKAKSYVDQTATGITQTVSSTYATKTELSDMASGAEITKEDSSKREIITEDAAELPLITLTAYGESVQDGTPTPDAPVPIRCVRGRNLFDIEGHYVSGKIAREFGENDTMTGPANSDNRGWGYDSSEFKLDLDAGRYTVVVEVFTAGSASAAAGRIYKAGQDSAIGSFGRDDINSVGAHIQRFTLKNAASIGIMLKLYGSVARVSVLRSEVVFPYIPYGYIRVISNGKNRLPLPTWNEIAISCEKSSAYYNYPIQLKPNTTYHLKTTWTDVALAKQCGYILVAKDKANQNWIGVAHASSGSSDANITTGADGILYLNVYATQEQYESMLANAKPQLEDGTEATEYEPYRESVSYIDLKGHEPVGLLDGAQDVLCADSAGRVWIDKHVEAIDMGTLTGWGYNSNEPYKWFYTLALKPYMVYSNTDRHVMSTSYAPTTRQIVGNDPSLDYVIWNDNSGYLGLRDYRITRTADLPTALSGVMLYYPLPTPQTIELGYITLPTSFDNGTVHVDAEIQPVIDASWWTKAGYDAGKAFNDGNNQADLNALKQRVTTNETSITQTKDSITSLASLNETYTKPDGTTGTNSIKSQFTQTANAINAKVDKNGVIASINASVEEENGSQIKISADKVNITGTTIFSALGSANKVVTSTQTQWYSSTSATTKANGSWSTTQPTVTAGRYIWERQYITYSNGDTEYKPSEAGVCTQGQTDLSAYSTTSQMNTAIGNAVDNLEIGGRNLAHKSKLFGNASKTNREVGYYNGNEVLVAREDGFNEYQVQSNFRGIAIYADAMGFEVGEKLVYSANVRSDSTVGTTITFYCMAADSSGTRIQSNLLHMKTRAVEYDGSSATIYSNGSFPAGAEERVSVEITWLQAAQDLLDAGGTIRFTIQVTSSDWSAGNVALWAAKLERGNKATDWTPAPEDTDAAIAAVQTVANAAAPKTSAVSRTQRIYYQSASTTKPATPGTASSDWVSDESGAPDKWTLKRMSYSSAKPYIYTCEQKQVVSGTVSYTPVLLDDTTTVIDGGKIITGSVTANALNADNINASKTLTIGAFQENTQNDILNSNIQIGGRNLLLKTKDFEITNSKQTGWNNATSGFWTFNTDTDGFMMANVAQSNVSDVAIRSLWSNNVYGVSPSDEFTVSMWIKIDDVAVWNWDAPLIFEVYDSDGERIAYQDVRIIHSNTNKPTFTDGAWVYFTCRFAIDGTTPWSVWTDSVPEQADSVAVRLTLFKNGSVHYKKVKLEQGNVATDWSPAPEDTLKEAKAYTDKAISPIASKEYTEIIGTANDLNDGSLYFAKVFPTDYNAVWQVKLRIEITTPITYQQSIDVMISGRQSAYMSYDAVVARSNAALGMYFINLYRATSTGISNNVGHALGFGLRASTNPANSNYARTIKADVIETTNCAITLLDTAVKYDSLPGYNTTNYGAHATSGTGASVTELQVSAYGQNASNNGNTYDRTYHNNPIKAATAITAGRIICGTSSGYKNIGAGITFDLSYPLLYAVNAIAAGSTRNDTYITMPTVTFSNNGTITSGAAYAQLYLVGSVSGNTFTIATSPFMTTIAPTSADGKFYIPLGIMSSATQGYFESSKNLYAYIDGKFRQVTPTEIVATHRIYYRTTAANNSLAAPSAWVDEATANVYNTWTTKVPPLANGIDSSMTGYTKYPCLYTCEQRKRLDGTVECTKVLLDENTTVIDGGNIITNSIAANKIKVNEINIGDLAGEIGGRNLVRWSKLDYDPSQSSTLHPVDYVSVYAESGSTSTWELTTEDGNTCWHVSGDLKKTKTISFRPTWTPKVGLTMTASADVKIENFSSGTTDPFAALYVGGQTIDGSWRTPQQFTSKTFSRCNGEGWQRVYITFTYGDYAWTNKASLMVYWRDTAGDLYIRNVKLEKGNKHTDWTPAPEDVDSAIDDASKTATNYIHADSTGINIYDSNLANASKYYLRQTAGGTYIYRNSYLKAKYEDTITLYGGSNAGGANPKVELTSTDFKMTDSGGIQRLLLDSTNGAIIGRPDKGRVRITDAGMTIYDTNSRKRTTVDASGLTIYDASEVDVGNFAATARIGKTNSSRFLMNADSLQAYDSSNIKYFEVSADSITFGADNTVATTADIGVVENELNNKADEEQLTDLADGIGSVNESVNAFGGALEEFSTTTGDALDILSEQMEGVPGQISSAVKEEKDAREASESALAGDISNAQADINSHDERLESLESAVKIKTDGIYVGKPGSAVTSRYTADSLQFLVNGNTDPVAYIGVENGVGKLFVTNAVVVQELQFGDWAFTQRGNGHLTLKWIG